MRVPWNMVEEDYYFECQWGFAYVPYPLPTPSLCLKSGDLSNQTRRVVLRLRSDTNTLVIADNKAWSNGMKPL